MNKLFAFFVLIFCVSVFDSIAQTEGTVTPKSEYASLSNLLERSDTDAENPKKNSKPKFWIKRADIFMNIYNLHPKYIEGQPLITIKFNYGSEKEIIKEQKNGSLYETYVYRYVKITFKDGQVSSYEETKKIHNKPLKEASNALKKAVELDTENKFNDKIKESYEKLYKLYVHAGGRAYRDKDYKNSLAYFENGLKINDLDLLEGRIDTAIIYTTGVVASLAKETDKTIKYLKEAGKHGLEEPNIYILLKNSYFEKGDTLKGVKALNQGFESFPDNLGINFELINYYLAIDKGEDALSYIKIAQEKDPTNVALVFIEGTLYDKQGDFDKALELYNNAIEINPDFMDSYYNKGVIYYNKAQSLYSDANKERDDTKYKALLEEATETLKKTIEPMNRCIELVEGKAEKTTEDIDNLRSIYGTLKSVYYRLQSKDDSYKEKYDEIKSKIDNLK